VKLVPCGPPQERMMLLLVAATAVKSEDRGVEPSECHVMWAE
jgi:hypothetical protein